MPLIQRFQALIEKLFFKGTSSRASEALSYMIVNLFLMVVVFDLALNTVVYNWTGGLYSSGFHLNTALDNAIPFSPIWAIFYLYLFYWALEATMVFFAFIYYKQGYALAWALVLVNLVADLIYLVFPVTTDIYRAQIAAHPIVGSGLADAIYAYYKSDLSYNCFPSLHAAFTVLCFYAWYRFLRVKRNPLTIGIAVLALIIAAGTVLSTLFVKQHYIADEIAGIALGWAGGKLCYDRLGGTDTKRRATA